MTHDTDRAIVKAADAMVAAETQRLRAENARLREALKDLADMCEDDDAYPTFTEAARNALKGE